MRGRIPPHVVSSRLVHGMIVTLICVMICHVPSTPALAQGAAQCRLDRIVKGMRLSNARHVPAEDPDPQYRVSATRKGYLRVLGVPPASPLSLSSPGRGNARVHAHNFLKENRAAFGLDHRHLGFSCRAMRAQGRRRFVRFGQTYAGIPVFGADAIVQLNDENGVEFVSSHMMTVPELYEEHALADGPLLAMLSAEQIAVGLRLESRPDETLRAESAALMVYKPSLVGNVGPVCLVWKTIVASETGRGVLELVLVDARSGDIVLHYAVTEQALHRKVYYTEYTDPVKIFSWPEYYPDIRLLARSEGQLAYQDLPVINKIYDIMGDVYDFYHEFHGRDSIDNAGMPMVVEISNVGSAVWISGDCAIVETGHVADDVIAHEFTHGVTEDESDLIYLNESGAICESFSDMWGEWIDQWNGRGDDSPQVRWLIGEDKADGVPVRNMRNPEAAPFGDPDRKGSPHWQDYRVDSRDNGGVHTNCGVNNKLCYLLTDGDVFNGYTIEPMGMSRIAELYYEVQTHLLNQAADYYGLYCALTQAAINLEWTNAERCNLENACRAVEICDPNSQGL